MRNEEPLREQGYSTELIGIEATKVLERRDPSKPLLLCVLSNAPHAPVHRAPGQTPREVGSVRTLYVTMLASMDEAVGQVLESLDNLGLKENTIVFFAIDNGGDPKYGGGNGGLRGRKYSTLEVGVRTPAILRWPERLPTGTSHQYMINLDLLPTLCDWLQVDAPESDGLSIAQGLAAHPIPRRDLFFFGSDPEAEYSALLTPPHKLVRRVDRNGTAQEWLFDVEADAGEEQDLSATRPELLKAMSTELASKAKALQQD